MTITTRMYTRFFGAKVGSDAKGNVYFRSKRVKKGEREKRWVLYNGAAEPSKVAPEWHGWLHYTTDTPPGMRKIPHYKWQKEPIQNLTGTEEAYFPPGSLLKSGRRAPTTSDYEPWIP